ncbi:putative ATP-dependent RNA helicase ucp12 [Ophidiomyces ophidiicola]|nr:putative ATP-dependent RNA helicase ucp12 [Ophidiomyces ophidiicola]
MTGTIEVDPEARTIKYFNEENGRVFVHPSSALFDAQGFSGAAAYVSYFSKLATSKVFIRDLTPFNAYALLLFAGPITLDGHGRGLVVDEWLPLRGWARIGVLASRLRMMLDRALARRLERPAQELGDDAVVEAVRHLVLLNGQDQ